MTICSNKTIDNNLRCSNYFETRGHIKGYANEYILCQ